MKRPFAILIMTLCLTGTWVAHGQTSNWTVIERDTNSPHFSPLPPTTSITASTPTEPVLFDEDLIPDDIKERYKKEAYTAARQAIDRESRPKVYFQHKVDLNGTNVWETILMIEPWRLSDNYRVVIE